MPHREMAEGMRWQCGVTTCSQRRCDPLPRTLASLKEAGFGGLRLFVDGVSDGFDDLRCETTYRMPQVGVVSNWWLALHELYARDRSADRYALFQDDLVCVRNLRQYLDGVALDDGHCWNLLTFRENEALMPTGRVGFFPSDQRGRGAVALVFPRKVAERMLTDGELLTRKEQRNLDGAVNRAMRRSRVVELCHNPSLVQHTGMVSVLGNAPCQVSGCFPGEGHDLCRGATG